ncbi:FlgO family outer membrane protein [Pseudoalteromonas lipolytica]|uniref:FlgO family outer membrane protein n=1 Tax=Pseudoalteromonas lipolytica TaxID=570156 RepID=UPI0008256486|nr:FlgO family outer membrane protein [Pseudoalteromonas lipolytica]
MRLLVSLIFLSLAGCKLSEEPKPVVSTAAPKAVMAPYTVHQYVADLSSQLSRIQGAFKSNARIAVTSFYLADALDSGLAEGQGAGLSQQIQESLMTQFAQLGYHTIEYRLENNLNLQSSADSMLSRNTKNLRQRQNIDFMITGTLTRQQHAYIVNARLVDAADQRIVSAASTEIPINVMWGSEKVQQRGGMIYRSEY